MTEESRQSGTLVMLWISFTAWIIRSTSSAKGTPMFTSSTIAPPASCWATSMLMRSPMMQNGWSSPIITSLEAERRTVCMSELCLGPSEGALFPQELFGLLNSSGGVRRVAVGPDGVRILLGDGGAPDH